MSAKQPLPTGQRQLSFSFLWLFSQIQHPLICLSADYKVITINDSMSKLLNTDREKILRRSFLKLLKRLELTTDLPEKLPLIECSNIFSIKSTQEPHTEWNNWEWHPHWLRTDNSKRKQILILLGQQIGHTQSQSELFKTYTLKESFQLSQLFDDLIALFQPLAKQKQIELHYCQPDETPERVVGYRQRFYYILWRLLNYILKHADAGKIHISCKIVHLKAASITLNFTLQYIAADILRDAKEQATEAYTRDTRTTDDDGNFVANSFAKGTTADDNTTINQNADPLSKELTIVKELIQNMHGSIEAQNSKNSTFSLTLPFDTFSEKAVWECHEADSPYHATRNTIPDSEPAYLKILIVEDEKICQEHLKDILNNTLNCQIDVAENAQTALNYLNQKKTENGQSYDVAFMDIGLPDKDGIRLTREIRHRLKLSLPILAITGYDWDIEKLEDGLFNGFIKKPVTPHKLQHTFNRSQIKVSGCKKDDQLSHR